MTRHLGRTAKRARHQIILSLMVIMFSITSPFPAAGQSIKYFFENLTAGTWTATKTP